jgi:hypothetical protein
MQAQQHLVFIAVASPLKRRALGTLRQIKGSARPCAVTRRVRRRRCVDPSLRDQRGAHLVRLPLEHGDVDALHLRVQHVIGSAFKANP